MSYNLRDNGWAETYESSTISSPNVLGLVQSPFLSKYGYYTGDDGQLHLSSVYAGKYVDDSNYPFGYASAYGTNTALANPYWILKNGDGANKNRQEVTQFNLNIMPKWEITKHLYVTNRFAYQLNRTNEKYYLPEAGIPVFNYEGYGDVTSVVKSLFSKETSVYEDLRINWAADYGKHAVSAFGGVRFTSNRFSDSYMRSYNTGNDKMPNMSNSNKFPTVDGAQDGWNNLAYYLQGRWSIKNTYFLEGTLSAETSSRFGIEAAEGLKLFGVRWGFFPSLQAGWVISNEKWMQKAKGINYLKLTVGYDESGNDNIDYAAARTYFKSYTFLKNAIALQLANIENPAIQWETTRKWNFGLNGSFLKDRVQAGVDFYVSNTDNLITYKSINYMSGMAGYMCNDGSLRNIGAEAKANVILVNGKNFKWQLGATLGHYKNEITSLPEGDYTQKIYGARYSHLWAKPQDSSTAIRPMASSPLKQKPPLPPQRQKTDTSSILQASPAIHSATSQQAMCALLTAQVKASSMTMTRQSLATLIQTSTAISPPTCLTNAGALMSSSNTPSAMTSTITSVHSSSRSTASTTRPQLLSTAGHAKATRLSFHAPCRPSQSSGSTTSVSPTAG